VNQGISSSGKKIDLEFWVPPGFSLTNGKTLVINQEMHGKTPQSKRVYEFFGIIPKEYTPI